LSFQSKMENISEIVTPQPIGRVLSRMGKSILHLLNAKLNYLDIDRYYYALLLIELGEGKITQNELAQQLETDKVSIVRIIDYLAAKGYVERLKSPTDKRKYCLTLTDKARIALPGIKNSLNEITESAFEGIPDSQKTAFYSTLDTIKKNLRKANTT
jgi:MarR family transcriptional regulator, transcriptional regulator for hemolysin